MRIACLGGGPGGLLAALLAKRADPAREVSVFERNRAGDTFGFGVVFSDATLDGIDAADPVLRRALTGHGVHWDPIEVRLRGERWTFGGNGMAAVARRTLLSLLAERALEAGVDLRFNAPVQPDDLFGADHDGAGYDLVIASDGANSAMRARFAGVFGPSVVTATAKFIWFGTTYPFGGLTFVHEQSPHGVFAVHGYPIGGGVSTFIVETDEPSWRAAGLDGFDPAQPPGPSDEVTRAYLEKLFAEQIDGCPLLVNNSRWGNFRTWRTRRWRHREGRTAVALLGDAAHTAHFSVGSGTKMAMEDAIALVAALDGVRTDPDAIDAALAVYEAERASSRSTSSAARCPSPSCASATPRSSTRCTRPGGPPTGEKIRCAPPSASRARPSRIASCRSMTTWRGWPPDPCRCGPGPVPGDCGSAPRTPRRAWTRPSRRWRAALPPGPAWWPCGTAPR